MTNSRARPINTNTIGRSLWLIITLVFFSLIVMPNLNSVTATETCANEVFAALIEPLRAKTNVPVRLPRVLGGEYDAVLYAEIGLVGPTRFAVRIGQFCERSYCPYGTVSGKKLSNHARRPRGRQVELAGGVVGYFIDGSRSSKDSSMTWDQGEYRYTIAIYGADRTAMIRVTNSALSCDNR